MDKIEWDELLNNLYARTTDFEKFALDNATFTKWQKDMFYLYLDDIRTIIVENESDTDFYNEMENYIDDKKEND